MKDYSLLIVDDDEVDRYAIKRLLRSGGIDAPIFEKSDGKAAIEFFREHQAEAQERQGVVPPILVFLDINMPRMDGFEFLEAFKKLRTEKLFEAIIFLMLTSSDNPRDQERVADYPFVKGYISKLPATPAELLAHIKAYLPVE